MTEKKELLIVRSGQSYLRFRPEGHELCSFDKASVFPLEEVERVKSLARKAAVEGKYSLELKKLTIIETPYAEER